MRSILRCVVAAVIGAGSVVWAQTTPEVEPNETKAQATVVSGMLPGDTLTGSSTGTATTPGATSIDTWDVTTAGAPTPGIYRYRLVISSTTNNHTISIRGLNQAGGVIGATDSSMQAATPSVARFIQWYANETPSRIYCRVQGLSTTTEPYTLTLERLDATPTVIANPIDAGPLFISSISQTSVDTDLWLYDASLNAITDAGNDDESAAGGGTGATTQSRLQRNLPAGTYILAIAPQNMANNLASPVDDDVRSRNVMDFPNAICTSSAVGGTQNFNFVIGNRCTGASETVANAGLFMEVRFLSFTLVGAQLPDPVGFSAGSASPSAVGPGGSTTLSVTVTGGSPASVTGDLSAFGLSGAEAFSDPDLDNVWTYTLNVPVAQSVGAYSVVVTAPGGLCASPSRTIALNVTPANNTCANAIPIVVGGSYPGTTLGAVGAGGMAAGCNTITGTNPGVWYTFTETSPTPRRLKLNLCDPVTNFDAQIAVYTGSCGAFSCVWGNDTGSFGCPLQQHPGAYSAAVASRSNTPVIINWTPGAPGLKCTSPGTTYYIVVTNRTAANGGNFVLHLDDTGETCEGTPPAHNACASARPLTAFPVWDDVFLNDAIPSSPQVSCSDPANTTARGAIWYSFMPTQSGDFYHAAMPVQGAVGSNADSVLTVYSTSTDCSALTEVVCSNTTESYDEWFGASPARAAVYHMMAGTQYYILFSLYSATVAPNTNNVGFDFVPDAPPACPADLDDGSGLGVPDGGVDINDLLYFLAQYEAGALPADLDDGSFTGTPDGGVDINDLLFFLSHYEAGC